MSKVPHNPLDQLIKGNISKHSKQKLPAQPLVPKGKKQKYRKYPLNLPAELHAKIKFTAYQKGRTMNELIVTSIKKGLGR